MRFLSFLKDRKKRKDEGVVDFFDTLTANEHALSVMSVSFLVGDENGIIRQYNSQFLRELDAEDQNLRGKEISDVFDIFHGKQDILSDIYSRLKKGEAFIELLPNTYIRSQKLKKKFYIQGQFYGKYKEKKLSRLLLIFRNVEEELTQEYLLNMALAKTKIYPWFYDLERDEMIIDLRWFEHLGLSSANGALKTEEFAALVHPDDRDMLIEALSMQMSGKMNKDVFSYRLKRADGSWEWFEELSVYLGQVDGAPYRIVGVCQSIQEHKIVESNLIAARDKAQESDRLKSAFLANMSHEIRTPLNAIVGFSNLLTYGEMSFDKEEIKEYVKLINTNSEQLLLLISDILDLSKIESNTMEFHYTEQSLNDLLTEIYHMQVLNMSPEVELRLDIPKTDIKLKTDAMRLKQVINNLVNNAIKFTARGYIRLGYRLAKEGQEVEFFVEDTGKGISEEHLSRIFERFYKSDYFAQGAGLGLSICQTILEYLGGSIECTSKLHEGTCFTVRYPIVANE